MIDTEEQDEQEPMHPAAKKFLEVVFQDVTVEGCTRHLEFLDKPDGSTSVLLVAPEQLGMSPVVLGFPAGWFPPADEEWDESFQEEMQSEVEEMAKWMADPDRPALKSEALKAEEYEQALEHENDLSPAELDAECAVLHPGKPHGPHIRRGVYALQPGETEQERDARLKKLQPWRWP